MMSPDSALAQLSDCQLVEHAKQLAAHERRATVDVIAALAQLDARRLYLREGFSSLFTYCTQVLCYSEDAAYFRITAARVVQRFPLAFELLAADALSLTAVKLLAPILTEQNHRELLDAAGGKSKREVEHLVAEVLRRPDTRASVRKLPPPRTLARQSSTHVCAGGPGGDSRLPASAAMSDDRGTAPPAAPVPRQSLDSQTSDDGLALQSSEASVARVAIRAIAPAPVAPSCATPWSPGRYHLQMTVGEDTYVRLRRAQDLLRHSIPNGNLAEIFDRALVLLVEQLERQKWGAKKETARAGGNGRRREGPQPRSPGASMTAAVSMVAEPVAGGPVDRTDERGSKADAITPLGCPLFDLPNTPEIVGGGRPLDKCPNGPQGALTSGARARTNVPGDTARARARAKARASTPAERTDVTAPQLVPARAGTGDAARSLAAAGRTVDSRAARRRRSSRYIPAGVRRAAWLRAGGRCTFIGPAGRCDATTLLEFHHAVPFADGGPASEDNISVLCRAHNMAEDERWSGGG